jgi:GT2 family glycosyltransferase
MNRGEAISRVAGSFAGRRGGSPDRPASTRRHDASQPLRDVAATLLYQYWIARFDRLSTGDRRRMRQHLEARAGIPALRVVVRFDRHSGPEARRTLRSLAGQLFQDWRAVLIFDATCDEELFDRVKREAARDSRVTVAWSNRDDETRRVLDRDPPADPIVAIAGGVVLRPHALYLLAVTAADNPEATLIYADEDRLNSFGVRCSPYFKAQFSPELARSKWYPGPCMLIRAPSLRAGEVLDPAPDGDGMSWLRRLAAQRGAGGALRLPFILYSDVLAPRPPDVVPAPSVAPRESPPRVSLIILTKDHPELIGPCLRSIDAVTDYPRSKMEIVVVDNGTIEPRALTLLADLEAAGQIRLVRDPRPFNFAAINDEAAALAFGHILVFLNNDTEIVDPAWLRRLVQHAAEDGVGAVGPKLVYGNGRVQHGGIVLGTRYASDHAHTGLSSDASGYAGLANAVHEVSAVTGACLAVGAAKFREVGGFDPELRMAFNDVLLCLELQARGYRNLYLGDTIVVHHESKTRGRDATREHRALYQAEARYVRERHPGMFADDPYYNPNLSARKPYRLAFPPRLTRPWRSAGG